VFTSEKTGTPSHRKSDRNCLWDEARLSVNDGGRTFPIGAGCWRLPWIGIFGDPCCGAKLWYGPRANGALEPKMFKRSPTVTKSAERQEITGGGYAHADDLERRVIGKVCCGG